MIVTYVVLFLLGLIQDVIITGITLATVKKKVWLASILSILNTFVNGSVIIGLVSYMEGSLTGLAMYSIGGGVGVALAIIYSEFKE